MLAGSSVHRLRDLRRGGQHSIRRQFRYEQSPQPDLLSGLLTAESYSKATYKYAIQLMLREHN